MEYYGTLGPACGSVQTLKEMLAAGMTGVRLNLSHGDLEENGHWIRMVQEAGGTLGPACGSVQTLKEMLAAGMTGVRLNLSHGDLEENGHWIRMVQEAGRELRSQVQILMDLRGPELRLGKLKEEIRAEEGGWLILGNGGLPVPEEALAYMCPGDRVLIDDGKVELEVVLEAAFGRAGAEESPWLAGEPGLEAGTEAGAAPSASGCRIMARVVRGGLIKSGKSLAIEGKAVPMPTLTESDRKNIRAAVSYDHGPGGPGRAHKVREEPGH